MELLEHLKRTLGDGYRFERELGGGGMSRVFLAEERALGRMVVVKVLKPELGGSVSGERFAREIRTAAKLQQANIVPLLSAGDLDGVPYYTMPFVDGESLRARLAANGAQSIQASVSILRDVARALAYAHEHGIVHRDIKPENVLLSGDAAVVTDFGIAKALAVALRGSERPEADEPTDLVITALTVTGGMVGTPAYIAPEQAAGDPSADHRVDLYAFGCLAFELLAGRPPFHRRTAAQLLAAHLSEAPPSLAALRPDAPPALAALAAACLEKSPSARPESAREILRLLDQATTPSELESAGPGISHARSRLWSMLGIAAALLVVFAVAVYAWRSRSSSRAGVSAPSKAVAVLPFTNVGGDTAQNYLADGIADELTTALTKVPGLRVASRTSAFAFSSRHDLDVREIGRQLGVGAVLEGTVQRAGNQLRVTTQLTNVADGLSLWSESYRREVKDVFAVQDEIARAIVGALRLTLADKARVRSAAGTTNLQAYDLYMRGAYLVERRGSGVTQAADLLSQAIAHDSTFARAYGKLSETLELVPYFSNTSAAAVETRAVTAAQRALALDSTVAEAHIGLALARSHAFRWQEAEVEFRRALASDSMSATARTQYGRHLYDVARFPEAIAQLRIALSLDPTSATPAVWLAHSLSITGNLREGLEVGRRAVEMDSSNFVARHYVSLDLIKAGRLAEARALALGTQGTAPHRALGAYDLGAAGDVASARATLADLRRLPPNTWMIHTALAYALLGLRDTSAALTELERALAAREITPKWTSFADWPFDEVRHSARFAAVVRGFGLDDKLFTSRYGGRPVP